MAGPEIRSRRTDQRRGSPQRASETMQKNQGKGNEKGKAKEKFVGPMDRWVEPALDAPKPSYQDQGAGPYGVLEHMQPLGEAPSARVKARVKVDGTRKSVLGRSSAAVGGDAQETPEGSPAPATAPSVQPEPATQQPIIIDDEKDEDYAPTANGKKRDRTLRTRAVKRKSESASATQSAPPLPPAAAPAPAPAVKVQTTPSAPPQSQHRFEYEEDKLRRVVQAAKDRAIEVGKPDLAAAVQEVYDQSRQNTSLRILLEAILTQQASSSQSIEFSDYVKAAKRKLKEAKNSARPHSASQPNGTQQKLTPTSLPPTGKFNVQRLQQPQQHPPPPPSAPPAPDMSRAITTTETPELSKPKISLKVKSPTKDAAKGRSANGTTTVSPKKRSGSVGSDSSLTSLTSNEDEDEMDIDEPGEVVRSNAAPSARPNGVKGKDQAAERGSLAVPTTGGTKRSSAEAELEAERDRAFAAKKQKLKEGVARDYEYQESNIRPTMQPPRSRAQKLRESVLGAPSLKVDVNGSRAPSARGSRAASTDLDSPLSELASPAISRQSTPRVFHPPKPTGKRAKTKQSPEKKQQQQQQAAYGGMPGAGGAGFDSPIGDDDNEEASENNDFCSACGGSGYLLCCDGCDRSFHFTCLDPPLNDNAKELDEPWFCFMCVEKRPAAVDSPEKSARGLFAPLLSSLKKRNPQNFELPPYVRNYFEGVATDKNGSFAEALNATKTTRGRPGYDEQPDYYRLRDSKGNLIHCYACSKTTQGKRAIVQCDHCSQHWHLDCLDPPLANPPAVNQNGKKVHDWMCPLHADQELRRVDMSLLGRRTIHVRKPKNPKIVDASLHRNFRNNGIIEVADDDTDTSDTEFFEQEDGGAVYKLPTNGIKLDFVDKVKETRVQSIHDTDVSYKRRRLESTPRVLGQANFAKRPFSEQQLALQLAQFANENKDLNLGDDRVEDLVGTLIAEAPPDVVDLETAAEEAEKTKSTSSVIPPSPPSSEQPEPLSAEQRKELQLLQELIRRRLENNKS